MKKEILGERLMLRLVFSVCVIVCFYYEYIWMTAVWVWRWQWLRVSAQPDFSLVAY